MQHVLTSTLQFASLTLTFFTPAVNDDTTYSTASKVREYATRSAAKRCPRSHCVDKMSRTLSRTYSIVIVEALVARIIFGITSTYRNEIEEETYCIRPT